MKKFLLLMVITFLFASCADTSVDDYNAKVKSEQLGDKVYKTVDSTNLSDQFRKFYRGYLSARDRQNMATIEKEVDDFKEAKQVITDVLNSYDTKHQNQYLIDSLKKYLVELQINDFPILRENYVSISNDKLWEHNVKVKSYSKDKHRKITYTGAAFANNATIKDSHEKIETMLTKLRFTSATYEWMDGASDSKTYELFSFPDSSF